LTHWLRAELNERGGIAVIPPKATRKEVIDCDFDVQMAPSDRKLLL
jgi:hypothetical protein